MLKYWDGFCYLSILFLFYKYLINMRQLSSMYVFIFILLLLIYDYIVCVQLFRWNRRWWKKEIEADLSDEGKWLKMVTLSPKSSFPKVAGKNKTSSLHFVSMYCCYHQLYLFFSLCGWKDFKCIQSVEEYAYREKCLIHKSETGRILWNFVSTILPWGNMHN